MPGWRTAHSDGAAKQQGDRHGCSIFDELVNGRFVPDTRSHFAQVIGADEETGCDAVILGCTEIPVLLTEDDSPLPVLDSTRVLARTALRCHH